MIYKELILLLFLILYNNFYRSKGIELLVVLFSCDRNDLLNKTIKAFYNHIMNYEYNINFNFNYVDSGTSDRLIYVNKYNIKNLFFMNPNNPEYAYGMFWSYLHGSYVMFLEDDRPFINNIENKILYPNFVEEAVLILDKVKLIKGIILKPMSEGYYIKQLIKTRLGTHILCIRYPQNNYYYTNGPSIYKVVDLINTGFFYSEFNMARRFKRLKWYLGFTYKGFICNDNITCNTICQTVSTHEGYVSTKKKTICKKSIY